MDLSDQSAAEHEAALPETEAAVPETGEMGVADQPASSFHPRKASPPLR